LAKKAKANRRDPIGRHFGEVRLAIDRAEQNVRKECSSFQRLVVSPRQPATGAACELAYRVLMRDITIKIFSKFLSNEKLCKRLDFEFMQQDGTTSVLPPTCRKFGVRTLLAGLKHPRCQNVVQKMISKAKNRVVFLP